MLHLLLHPEVRRIVRDVGQNGHERRARECLFKARAQRAIQIRHQRDHHVGPALTPESLQQAHRLAMKRADHRVHAYHQLRRSQRPTFLQHQVVNILQAQPRHLAEYVHRIQYFLQVDQPDFPPAPLLFHHLAQRIGDCQGDARLAYSTWSDHTDEASRQEQ